LHIKKIKEKDHMIISTDAEKPLKNSTSLHDKNLETPRNIIKAV
jgi:hypothetical protein